MWHKQKKSVFIIMMCTHYHNIYSRVSNKCLCFETTWDSPHSTRECSFGIHLSWSQQRWSSSTWSLVAYHFIDVQVHFLQIKSDHKNLSQHYFMGHWLHSLCIHSLHVFIYVSSAYYYNKTLTELNITASNASSFYTYLYSDIRYNSITSVLKFKNWSTLEWNAFQWHLITKFSIRKIFNYSQLFIIFLIRKQTKLEYKIFAKEMKKCFVI